MLSVSIDRASLSLAALVIGDQPTASGLWLAAASRADGDFRRTYAASPFSRRVQTGAILDGSDLGLVIYAQAATSAALTTLRDEVSAALQQFYFPLTVTEDGEAVTYGCDCTNPHWNDHDPGMAAAHLSSATVTIPCYPVGA